MKIVEQSIALNQPGSVKMILEEQDDLWLAYNIIAKGDTIGTDTTRKVACIRSSDIDRNDGSRNKKSSSKKDLSRVRIKLEIKVTKVDYERDSSVLRVRGKSLNANELMAPGSFHTLEIERNKEFDLTKKVWDSDVIDTLRESENTSTSDLAVMVLQQASAQVFLVGHRTTLCAKIDAGKAGTNKFYEKVFQAFLKHVNFDNGVRCVVIGSPGSVKEEFRSYLFVEARRLKMKSIEDNKSRVVTVNICTKDGLKEILTNNEVMGLVKHTKAASEIKAFKEFSDLLSTDSDRVCFGTKSVEIATEMMAIHTLLIVDDLVKSREISLRQKYVELVKSVKKSGGKAFVYSPMHVSGEELAQLTGIAAILRYPLPELEDIY